MINSENEEVDLKCELPLFVIGIFDLAASQWHNPSRPLILILH